LLKRLLLNKPTTLISGIKHWPPGLTNSVEYRELTLGHLKNSMGYAVQRHWKHLRSTKLAAKRVKESTSNNSLTS
jgi:hypothetical protein